MSATNGHVVAELYKRHRPRKFADVVGQEEAISYLTSKLKSDSVPQTLLFTGGSGTGKTTLARILRRKMGCSDFDYKEVNAADARGIDEVRKIRAQCSYAPRGGTCRMWLLDECHQITREGQEALLKLLEDTPRGVYFVLCTTNPQKVIRTIRTRCQEVKFKPLSGTLVEKVVITVLQKEGKALPESVISRIAEVAGGSAREAVQMADQALAFSSEEEQLEAVVPTGIYKDAFEIVRLLLWKRTTWKDLQKVLREVDDGAAEGLRRLILANATNEILKDGGNCERAAAIIGEFARNVFDSGRAGLCEAAFACFGNKK